MDSNTIMMYVKLVLYVIAGAIPMIGYYYYNMIKVSVGWNFIKSMGKAKMMASRGVIVLRIKHLSGIEEYKTAKTGRIIDYNYIDRDQEIKKSVIYDSRAVDYLNGIPILTCTPADIRPIDRDTGLFVNIPPEIINKLAVDSAKTAESEKENQHLKKMMMYGTIGIAICMILAFSYFNNEVVTANEAVRACYTAAGKSATIIANG